MTTKPRIIHRSAAERKKASQIKTTAERQRAQRETYDHHGNIKKGHAITQERQYDILKEGYKKAMKRYRDPMNQGRLAAEAARRGEIDWLGGGPIDVAKGLPTTPPKPPVFSAKPIIRRGPALSQSLAQQRQQEHTFIDDVKSGYVQASTGYRRLEHKVSQKIPTLEDISASGSRFARKHPDFADVVHGTFESTHQKLEDIGTPTQRQALAGFTFGSYKSLQQKPVKTTAMFGLGLGTGPAISGASKIGGALGAGTKVKYAAQATGLGVGGLYAYQTGTDIFEAETPYESGQVAAEAFYTEILPMGLGAMTGAKLAKIHTQKIKPAQDKFKIHAKRSAKRVSKITTQLQNKIQKHIDHINKTEKIIQKDTQKIATEMTKKKSGTITTQERKIINDKITELQNNAYQKLRKQWAEENKVFKELAHEIKLYEKQGKKPPAWIQELYVDLQVSIGKGGRSKAAAQTYVNKIVKSKLFRETIEIRSLKKARSTKTDRMKMIKKLQKQIKKEAKKESPDDVKIKLWNEQIHQIKTNKYKTITEIIKATTEKKRVRGFKDLWQDEFGGMPRQKAIHKQQYKPKAIHKEVRPEIHKAFEKRYLNRPDFQRDIKYQQHELAKWDSSISLWDSRGQQLQLKPNQVASGQIFKIGQYIKPFTLRDPFQIQEISAGLGIQELLPDQEQKREQIFEQEQKHEQIFDIPLESQLKPTKPVLEKPRKSRALPPEFRELQVKPKKQQPKKQKEEAKREKVAIPKRRKPIRKPLPPEPPEFEFEGKSKKQKKYEEFDVFRVETKVKTFDELMKEERTDKKTSKNEQKLFG